MNSSTYTGREWTFLTHYGEYDWPDDWRERRDDRAHWLPAVERIAQRHGLAMTQEPEVGVGSNLAYLLDDAVVKVFARYNPIRYPREVEALHLLASVPEACTPRLIAEGVADVGSTLYHYIVLERLPGRLFRWTWDEMAQEERVDVIRQLAPVVHAIHDAPIDGLKTFGTGADEWRGRMKQRAGVAHAFFVETWSDYLLDQLPAFLNDHLSVLSDHYEPRLLNGDLIGGNILVEQRAGTWNISGMIDFGDAEVGPLEYEWISLCQKACRSNREMIEAFFTEYGFDYPFTGEMLRRMRLYSLLHGFPMMRWAHEEHSRIRSLAELIDTMNGPG